MCILSKPFPGTFPQEKNTSRSPLTSTYVFLQLIIHELIINNHPKSNGSDPLNYPTYKLSQVAIPSTPLPHSLTVDLHPEVDPHGERAGDQSAADHQLPLAGRSLHLGERLAEGGPVQLLDLLLGQLAPLALLLLTQSLVWGNGGGKLFLAEVLVWGKGLASSSRRAWRGGTGVVCPFSQRAWCGGGAWVSLPLLTEVLVRGRGGGLDPHTVPGGGRGVS